MLARYVAAHDSGDLGALTALLREDARLVMPPFRGWYAGRSVVVQMAALGFDPELGHLRGLPTGANSQPAVAWYLRRADETEHRPLALDVLRIEDQRITEITTFASSELFSTFELPPTLAAQ